MPEHVKLIREAVQRGQLTDSERFRDEIEKKLGVRISNKKQGRPRKKELGKKICPFFTVAIFCVSPMTDKIHFVSFFY